MGKQADIDRNIGTVLPILARALRSVIERLLTIINWRAFQGRSKLDN